MTSRGLAGLSIIMTRVSVYLHTTTLTRLEKNGGVRVVQGKPSASLSTSVRWPHYGAGLNRSYVEGVTSTRVFSDKPQEREDLNLRQGTSVRQNPSKVLRGTERPSLPVREASGCQNVPHSH